MARLAGIMAREVGLDAHVAVRAAFVCDSGKAHRSRDGGTHSRSASTSLRKHGEKRSVLMAMARATWTIELALAPKR